MNSFLKMIFISVLEILPLLVFLLSAHWIMTNSHEQAHQAIYKSYGINSTIKNFNPLTGENGRTIAVNSRGCNDYCELAHNMNEVYGYQFDTGVLIIISALYIFFLYSNRAERLNLD